METNGELSICKNLPDVRLVDSRKDVKKTDTDKMIKNKMSDDDKCINNNQDICMKIENMNSVNKTDCSVVIDDETQSKQQVTLPPSQQTSGYGCVHYKRKAKFVVSIWKIYRKKKLKTKNSTNTHE